MMPLILKNMFLFSLIIILSIMSSKFPIRFPSLMCGILNNQKMMILLMIMRLVFPLVC